jgi:hypothetical protein
VALALPTTTTALRFAACYFDTNSGMTVIDEAINTDTLSTSPVAVVGSPPAGTIRHFSSFHVANLDSASAAITIKLNDVPIVSAKLSTGDTLSYERTAGCFTVLDATGAEKESLSSMSTNAPISAVAAVNLQAGQPVYIDGTTGQFGLARADIYAASFVAGLVAEATAAGFVANLVDDSLTLQDWTAIVGSASLQRGQNYFLGTTPGTLSLTAPTTPGQSCAVVGMAISTIQLLIDPTGPILL